jgi:cytochrome c-type biogenesis protein CcmH/NrfF
MNRFIRTVGQSILSPVISTSLYFVVFGSVIGGYIEKIDGVSYGSYIVPGLLMLTLLTQSISNTSFGIFFPKFNGTIESTVDPNLIHKNLRCLVCQGQSISDSNSDFAQTIKLVVKDLIDEGKTEEEIYAFMSDKYGDWIVFKPQFNVQNSLLWILPYIFLILGGFFIFSFLKIKKR